MPHEFETGQTADTQAALTEVSTSAVVKADPALARLRTRLVERLEYAKGQHAVRSSAGVPIRHQASITDEWSRGYWTAAMDSYAAAIGEVDVFLRGEGRLAIAEPVGPPR
jgi:2',3'-cyclic-nucleotide 2'-phosphodiesterase (5'-nucleotidase family)